MSPYTDVLDRRVPHRSIARRVRLDRTENLHREQLYSSSSSTSCVSSLSLCLEGLKSNLFALDILNFTVRLQLFDCKSCHVTNGRLFSPQQWQLIQDCPSPRITVSTLTTSIRKTGSEIPEAWMQTIWKHPWEHSNERTANHRATRSSNHHQTGTIYKQHSTKYSFA